ncbi:MAG: hypothetical protein H0X39_00005 [Actinobacteria bacterium]|nr:hypothetical protein [Actinomycetota bacterium]
MSGGVETVTAFTSTAIQAAIDKIVVDTGGAGGVVLLPTGTYLVTSTIQIPSKVTLQGAGKQTTILIRQSDITALSMIGTAGGVNGPGGIGGHIASPQMSDMQIQGNNAAWTSPLVQMAYVHTAKFENVTFANAGGVALYIQCEVWDSTWEECRWDNSGGSNISKPAMLVQSADGATFPAMGSSTDATNDLRFYHCTWEGFKDGAFWATSGQAGALPMGNLYFFGCKADQNQTALGDWFRFEGVTGVYLQDLDLSTYQKGSAYAGTPFSMFTFKACKSVNLRNWTHNQNSSETDCLIHFDGVGLSGNGNRYVTLDSIEVTQPGSRPFATGMVKFTGTNLNNNFDFISYPRYSSVSPTYIKPILNLSSGTVNYAIRSQYKPIPSKPSGAYTDSDIGTQEPGVPVGMTTIAGVDLTNHRLYVRYPDGTYKYATLT